MALGLDLDIEVYLNLAGLLEGVLNTVGGFLGGVLGGGQESQLPKQVLHDYRPKCGISFANHPGGKTYSAADYNHCMAQCERDAIELTVAVGALHDCLGITIDDGIEVDNCLYFLGIDSDILDADIDLLTHDLTKNSLCR